MDLKKKENTLVGGIALVMVGLVVLFAQLFVSMDLLILPLLALIFLTWGILARSAGPIIPGGILGGIGFGSILLEGPFINVGSEMEDGVFMLAFAAGWIMITLLTAVFTSETHWWALIPATIMATIGVGVLSSSALLESLAILGKFWPVLLILGGIIWCGKRARQRPIALQIVIA